jgi:hypothetical protein
VVLTEGCPPDRCLEARRFEPGLEDLTPVLEALEFSAGSAGSGGGCVGVSGLKRGDATTLVILS